jgi:hypothetical protein
MYYQKQKEIRLTKDGDKHLLYVRDDDESEEFDLNKDTYSNIFEYLKPLNSFSTPDYMIQRLLKGTAVVPSFSENKRYSIQELKSTIVPAKTDLKGLIKLNERMKNRNNNRKRNNQTRRGVKKTNAKRILIENMNKKKKKPMKKRQKTSKGKK